MKIYKSKYTGEEIEHILDDFDILELELGKTMWEDLRIAMENRTPIIYKSNNYKYQILRYENRMDTVILDYGDKNSLILIEGSDGKVEEKARDYLETKFLESCTITFTILQSMGTDYISSISYSTDNGKNWNTVENEDNKSEPLIISFVVEQGDSILWKGTANQFGYYDRYNNKYSGSYFMSSGSFEVQGNIMSLLYEDDYKDKISLEGKNGCFCYLFSGNTKLMNAENLLLPSTILSDGCYEGMFLDCDSMIKSPKLPATELSDHCYSNMFSGCCSLMEAPELPATILFRECYRDMFVSCESLTETPTLPATTLSIGCYVGMFSNCSNLVKTSELPATELKSYCYNRMFEGCSSLEKAPELPAQTLEMQCYDEMFLNCTSILETPILRGQLVNLCYYHMFKGCSSLNHVICLATNLNQGQSSTSLWLDDVSERGLFEYGTNIQGQWETGPSGIPEGWQAREYQEE